MPDILTVYAAVAGSAGLIGVGWQIYSKHTEEADRVRFELDRSVHSPTAWPGNGERLPFAEWMAHYWNPRRRGGDNDGGHKPGAPSDSCCHLRNRTRTTKPAGTASRLVPSRLRLAGLAAIFGSEIGAHRAIVVAWIFTGFQSVDSSPLMMALPSTHPTCDCQRQLTMEPTSR